MKDRLRQRQGKMLKTTPERAIEDQRGRERVLDRGGGTIEKEKNRKRGRGCCGGGGDRDILFEYHKFNLQTSKTTMKMNF